MTTNLEIPGLKTGQSADRTTISWSNRRIGINRLLMAVTLGGWLLAVPLTLFLTSSLLQDLVRWQQGMPTGRTAVLISASFFLIGWGAVLFISYTLLGWTWIESIQVGEEGIRVRYSGRFAPKEKIIPRDDIWRISFERFRTRRERELNFSLNIFHGKRRETLATWMNRRDKQKLYRYLRAVVESRGWTYIEFREREVSDWN